ncbi:MAG: peptidyl-prolyl cis-trans isomerase SurA [Methylophilaceae bacterium]|jgi:peptidyl-prolyl cis-trans isomerase SurA
MNKKIYLFLLYIFTIIQVSPNLLANEKYKELDRVVAIVEKEVITEVELKNAISQALKFSENKGKPEEQYQALVKAEVLDKLIHKSLIEQYALQSGFSVEQKKIDAFIVNVAKKNNMSIDELKKNIATDGLKFSRFVDNIRYELLLKKIKNKEISTQINISDFEIDSQLRKNAILNPDIFNLSHILIKNSGEASPTEIETNHKKSIRVYEILLSKQSFEKVAQEYSDDSTAKSGGNIGWKKEQDLPQLFNDEIAKINVGEITKPFKSPSGFHILKINEKKGIKKKKTIIKQTKLKHIIIKQNEITPEEEILKRLDRFRNLIMDGSETFDKLAKEYSEDGSAADGGNLGWVSPGTTLPIFESTYEALDISEISKPINTPLGWHILQVTDRRDNDLTDESIKYSARMQLVNQKTELIFKDWIKQLRDQSFIDIRLIQD